MIFLPTPNHTQYTWQNLQTFSKIFFLLNQIKCAAIWKLVTFKNLFYSVSVYVYAIEY
jgi:hypothetical protein